MQVLNLGEPQPKSPSARAEPAGFERGAMVAAQVSAGLIVPQGVWQSISWMGACRGGGGGEKNQPEMVVQVDGRWTCCAGRKAGVRGPFAPLNLDEKQSLCKVMYQ